MTNQVSDQRTIPQLSENAMTVLSKRYLAKDKSGQIYEDPSGLFDRVASAVAWAENLYGKDKDTVEMYHREFYELMATRKFLPNTPALINFGRPGAVQMGSACFVLPVGDSMEEIFDAVKNAALIHKSGGGTGFAFSRLRERGAIVGSTKGISSGPIEFMKVFNAATDVVKQGGARRGANMGILIVDHPDIEEFIHLKDDLTQMTNFNISVALTNEFMLALIADADYPIRDPRTRAIKTDKDGNAVTKSARNIMSQIVKSAWATGEPGVIFIDKINALDPGNQTIESTNPCGEQALPPYDSCNLGSINLGLFVKEDGNVDFDELKRVVKLATRFLDNVIDVNEYPIQEIQQQTVSNRRLGLGIMGFADFLVKLGARYDSVIGREIAQHIMGFISRVSAETSQELAEEKGAFERFYQSKLETPRRNLTLTTIAPTGSISIIAGCSSGLEPYFAIAYKRNILDGTIMTEVNPLFQEMAIKQGFYSEHLIREIANSNGSIQNVPGIPQEIKDLFRIASDISPEDHVRMQAAFQPYVDNGISKTINFDNSASEEDIYNAYIMAYELGCKAISVYRDGARPNQVLSTGATTDPKSEVQKKTMEPRPDVLQGETHQIKTGEGTLYVTINTDHGNPFEVFATIGKSGWSTMASTEAIGRLISLALRSGISVEQIVDQISDIGGDSPMFHNGGLVKSVPDAIAKTLGKFSARSIEDKDKKISCPDCGAAMVIQSGCYHCPGCGNSKCS